MDVLQHLSLFVLAVLKVADDLLLLHPRDLLIGVAQIFQDLPGVLAAARGGRGMTAPFRRNMTVRLSKKPVDIYEITCYYFN